MKFFIVLVRFLRCDKNFCLLCLARGKFFLLQRDVLRLIKLAALVSLLFAVVDCSERALKGFNGSFVKWKQLSWRMFDHFIKFYVEFATTGGKAENVPEEVLSFWD